MITDMNVFPIVMVIDPAVAYQPGDKDKIRCFLKEANGTYYEEMLWAGEMTGLHCFLLKYIHVLKRGQIVGSYWLGEFQRFFDLEHGIDIDGILLDMCTNMVHLDGLLDYLEKLTQLHTSLS
ncbi:family 31 glycoside hydrolase [Melampsora larici-populina 98AG31]|uniref:Family 31 glycoside hydrolase n=1 Tax=Melampsora larici-populina (strain 98AG31 / pathotype 3-4-7) TaxID=747676 RepID=F4S0B1_MELLP|nr:family 31 glycoside hydrolase [Melampsora larici-populina 98AG31]EGG01968.1 family 31 glycoside hydrolase [Melampsora larici-populina 98AG31]